MNRLRWVLALGVMVAGCEVSVGDCEEDDAGRCVGLFPDRDSSIWGGPDGSLDATTGTPNDGSVSQPDGAVALPDASSMDAATDSAASDGATGSALSETQFCEAQWASGKAWDGLLSSCNCEGADNEDGVRVFLAAALNYGEGPIASCLTRLDALKAKGVAYQSANAAACAAKFAGQFKLPSQVPASLASCMDGFDIAALEGLIGHGRQALAQLPECRAALAGTKAYNDPCTDSFECREGRRCRPVPGGGESRCQNPLSAGETCTRNRNEECADGLTCSLSVAATGATPAQYTCIPITELKLQGGNCESSSECIEGLICDVATQKCINPVVDRICN